MVGSVQMVWFKRDLRLADHRALAEAAQRGPVLPVYLIETEVIQAPDFDARHWAFIRDCLRELSAKLAERGAPLQVLRGEAIACLEQLRQQYQVTALWSHEETGNAITYARDRRVARWARELGLTWHELPSNGVVRRLTDRNHWHREWERRMASSMVAAPVVLGPGKWPPTASLPSAKALGIGAIAPGAFQRGGESKGHEVLASFLAERGGDWPTTTKTPRQRQLKFPS